jgi:hypothetical protein
MGDVQEFQIPNLTQWVFITRPVRQTSCKAATSVGEGRGGREELESTLEVRLGPYPRSNIRKDFETPLK